MGVAGGGGNTQAPRPATATAATLMRGKNEKIETFHEFKTTGQLVGSDREARPSVQYVQYCVLRNGFETLASMCVREGSSGALGCALIKSQLATATCSMSALARFADSSRTSREVGEVPLPDSCSAANRCYSMISSARTSSVGGILKPRALAALRLMTNSNLVACSIGRSAGLAPLRILSTKVAARRYIGMKSTP